MKPGLYEQIITSLLEGEVSSLGERACQQPLDPSDSHTFLAQFIHHLLEKGLRGLPAPAGSEDGDGDGRLQAQVHLCNRIVSLLQEQDPSLSGQKIEAEARKLMAVLAFSSQKVFRPDTPLSLGCLLTGTRQDPTLVSQLQKEILSCDRIDILCSFIKWSGVRLLREALESFAKKPGVRLRIITTSYMGATDLRAVEFLRTLPNTEMKVSYDTHRTRLHAKAYLFHRETGFGAAYVGSANISQAAMTDGLEWNTKISQYEQPFQWDKLTATFESYWFDREFEDYQEADRQRLKAALEDERSSGNTFFPTFDLRPYVFQQEILERIHAERTILQRNRHLIVAATGTGKTMIAAFDFRQWREWRRVRGQIEEPTFLFVAHREEILRQSLATFRAVLRDQNFGDLMVGGREPTQNHQLFISIQTLNSREFLRSLDPSFYSYLVIDEFHHAAAPSYRQLLQVVRPDCLLGLTATPERADGLDITAAFGGHFTAEIRLPDAINRKLLCPFQYFGLSDVVDYSGLRWERGYYARSDLEGAISANDIRCSLVIEKTREIVLDIRKARCLGFCVSQAHAAFMAAGFSRAGIPAACLTAESPAEERHSVQRRLQNREINALFVVDLFNEGVDIPAIDTVLFLRPTESLTVFLQQFGRGLRLSEGKDCLTVIDFIGQAHHNYRLDQHYRAMILSSDRPIEGQIRDGFTHLPAGCTIQLERQAREYILDNLHQAIDRSRPRLVQSIRAFEAETGRPLSFAAFLDFHNLEPDVIFRRASWSRLCVAAGVRDDFSDPDEERITKGLRRLQHVDDPRRIGILLDLLEFPPGRLAELPPSHLTHLLMLHFVIWGEQDRPESLPESLSRLQNNIHLCQDLRSLLIWSREKVATISPPVELPFPCPLSLYSAYTRDEILSGLGYWTIDRQPPVRQGVIFLPGIKADVFFITLNKHERDYSPTTMYEDYAISDRLFHWQSQSTTSDHSPTGRRYIHHRECEGTILLFVRENRKLPSGLGAPFHFLGPADYVSHQGSRPISFTWRLRHPIPAHLQKATSRLLVG